MRFISAVFVLCILSIPSTLISQTSVSAVAFDGIDDYISVADQPAWDLDSSDFTIETWIEFASVKPDDIFIGQDEGTGTFNKWIFGFLNGTLSFHINSPESGPVNPIVHSWTPATNRFYHLAVTRHGSDYFLYINGMIAATGSSAAVIPNVEHELTIGQAESFYHHGTMDEVRIWKKTRTQTEIRESMYRTHHWSEPGLTALWRFEENSGPFAYNTTGANHGTLMNDAQWTTASAPFAQSTVSRIISSAGENNFSGSSLFAAFQAQSGTDTVTVSKFTGPVPGTQPAGMTVLHNGYWVIQSTGNGTFTADLTFGLGANALSLSDQEDPHNITLFRRTPGSGGAWTPAGTAASASFGSVTFEGITAFGEFSIGTTTGSSLTGADGVFQSTASGIWGDAASWFLIGGSDDDGIPDANDDVIIRAGENIQCTAGGYVNNLLLLGASTGTRLSVSDYVGLYVNGILNSDATALSPNLITTGVYASITFAGSGRRILGNRWSGDVAGWSVNISMSDTARVLTDFKAGALGINSPAKFGTYDAPTDLYIDGGTENSGTLSVNGTYLFVSGNITRNNSYTSKFNSFAASWSLIEIGGTYLSAEQIKIGWPDYWYAVTNTLRIRSTSGLLINSASYGHMGTLEYIGPSAQTTGNELIGISNIAVKNPSGVQFLSTVSVTNLFLDTGNVTVGTDVSLTVNNLYAKGYSILGPGNVSISERVETAHADGLEGTFKNSGTIALTNWAETIVLNGAVPQRTGTLRSYFKDYPQQYISFVVNNPAGVTFNGSYFGNTLTLTDGNITVENPDTLSFTSLNAGDNEIVGTGMYIQQPGQITTAHLNGMDGTIQTASYSYVLPVNTGIIFNSTFAQTAGMRMPDSLGGMQVTNNVGFTFNRSIYFPSFNLNSLSCDLNLLSGVTLRTDNFASGNTRIMSGGGNFILKNGGNFSTQHPGGINGTLQISGDIRLGDSCTFSLGDANAVQSTGTYLPDTVQSIYFSNPYGTTISKPFHVRSIASVQNGPLDNSVKNFTLWDGATLHRYSGGSIAATPQFQNFYDVNYSGWAGVTGPEIPDSSTVLRNLLGGNWMTLSKSITVNGTIGNHLRTDSFTVRSMGTISPYMIVGHLSRFVNAPKEYIWEVADKDVQRYHPFSLIPSTLNDSGDITVTLYDTATTPLPSLPPGQKILRYYHTAEQSGVSALDGNISMMYNDADVNSAGIPDDDSLQVLQWKDGAWKNVEVVARDKYNNKLTAGPVDTLTTFIIAGTEKKGIAAFSRREIAFGSVLRPEYKYDTLYIKNTGTWPLQMNSLSFTDPWTFGGSLSSSTIPIDDSAAFVISFNAYHGGTSCFVYLYHNGTTGVDTVQLTGKAIYPDLAFSIGNPSFGTVPVGESKKDSVMIYNNGSYQLVISELVPGTPHFTAELEKDTIAAQDSGKFYITFAPQSEGTINAEIILRNNIYGSGDGYRIYPSGIATASQFAVEPSQLAFGDVHRGNSKKDSVLVKNPGAAVLHISGISSTVAGYSAVPSSLDIPSGDSAWVVVTFAPQSQGDLGCELIFHHSATTTTPDSVHLSGNGIEQVFTADKTSFSFGSVTVGNTRTDSMFVTNTGNITLTIASAVSSDPGQFIVSPASAVVPAGGKQRFIVGFKPNALGTQTGTVTFKHDGIPDSNVIAVSGFGQIPVFTASRTELQFGDVRIDSVRTDTLIITNNGNMSLAVTSAAVSDSLLTVNPHSVILSPGAKKEFTVTFAPKKFEGAVNARIVFTHNGHPSADTIAVQARATAPHFAAVRASIDFGGVDVGTSSADSLIVKNTGTAQLIISSVQSGDSVRYTVLPNASVIGPADSQWFRISYHPSGMEEEPSTIVFLHDADGGSDTVAVTGFGLMPKYAASADQIDLGEVRVGRTKNDSLEIENSGNSPLVISSIASNDSQFTVVPESLTVLPGAVRTIAVRFSPDHRGGSSASLILLHNAQPGADTIRLEGTGVEPLFAADRQQIDFGFVRTDSSRVDSVYVTNSGNMDLRIAAVHTGHAAFRVMPESTIIGHGASQYFIVTFSPNLKGTVSAMLTFASDAASSPDSLLLNGTGIAPEFAAGRNVINFGGVAVGNAKSESLFVKNTGTASLSIRSARSVDTLRFSVEPDRALIAPSDSFLFRITYHANEKAEHSSIVEFLHDAQSGRDTVPVAGHGLMPVFALSARMIDLGSVRVGTARRDSVEISNTGNSPLIISSVTSSDPQVTAVPDTFTVPSGEMRRIRFTFTPDRRGSNTVSLAVGHNASMSADTLFIHGTGVEPLFLLSRTAIDLGMMEKDSIRTDSVRIVNHGNADLVIDSVSLFGGIAQVSPLNGVIAPGDSMGFVLSVHPVTPGIVNGFIRFRHNAPAASDTVRYHVKVGPPVFAVNRRSVPFRTTLAGKQRIDSVLISNEGFFDLTIDSLTVSHSSFIIPHPVLTVKAQSVQPMEVIFSPDSAGVKNGMLIFKHNSRSGADTVHLFGTAVEVTTIAHARSSMNGSTAVIEGVMTRVKGGIAFIQDSTAALSILSAQSWWNDSLSSGGIRMGDVVRIGGTMSEANYLRQFVADDSIEFIRLARNTILPLPDSVSLAQLKTKGEQYEGRLIRLKGASIVNTADTVFLPQTSYSIVDASDSTQSVMLRIGGSEQTDLDGRRLPKKNFHFTGILYQFHLTDSSKGYQLLPLLNTDLESDPATVKDWAVGIPAQYILYNNFPNPFNPSTTIRFGVPEASTVRIEIYDILGRRISELYNDRMEPGYQQVTWNARVSTGIYFYRIECVSVSRPDRKFTEIKKMLLIK